MDWLEISIYHKEENSKLSCINNSPHMGKEGILHLSIFSPTSGGKCKIRTIKINNRKSLLSNKLHSQQVEKTQKYFLTKVCENFLQQVGENQRGIKFPC